MLYALQYADTSIEVVKRVGKQESVRNCSWFRFKSGLLRKDGLAGKETRRVKYGRPRAAATLKLCDPSNTSTASLYHAATTRSDGQTIQSRTFPAILTNTLLLDEPKKRLSASKHKTMSLTLSCKEQQKPLRALYGKNVSEPRTLCPPASHNAFLACGLTTPLSLMRIG